MVFAPGLWIQQLSLQIVFHFEDWRVNALCGTDVAPYVVHWLMLLQEPYFGDAFVCREVIPSHNSDSGEEEEPFVAVSDVSAFFYVVGAGVGDWYFLPDLT